IESLEYSDGSEIPARSLIDLRNAKNRDHVFSDRCEIAADADLEPSGIRLVEQLQHGLIDLDGAVPELRRQLGIGFGRDKRRHLGFTRHHGLLAPKSSAPRSLAYGDRSPSPSRHRENETLRGYCRSASRQSHKEATPRPRNSFLDGNAASQ